MHDPSRLRRALTVAALAVGVAWALLLLVWEDATFALTFDDAYYYFGIARNLVEGHGSTFDGLNATNGYHPLWLLAATPVYLVGLDGTTAVRALLGLQLVAYTGALVVLARFVASAAAGATRFATGILVAGFVLFAANPFVTKMFVNGLESGLSVLLYALLLARVGGRSSPRLSEADDRHRAGTALLLLLLVLTRTDAVVLLGCIGLWVVAELRPVLSREPLRVVSNLMTLLGPAALGLGAYLVMNQVRFDSALQISGLIKRADLDSARLLTLAVLVSLAAVIGVATWRRSHAEHSEPPVRRFALAADFANRTGFFAAFGLLLIAYYNTLQVQQWLWYYAPVGLYLGFLLLLGIADLLRSAVVEGRRDASPMRAMAPIAVILLLPLVVAFALQLRAFANPDVRSIQIANREAALWIDEQLPEDAVLASWDAGVLGYFADRPVVNLDGVVNSHEYYRAMRRGTVGEFLDRHDVGWIVNHGGIQDGEHPNIRRSIERWYGPEVAADAELQQTWPFRYAGTTVGSRGTEVGARDMAVFLYRLPDER